MKKTPTNFELLKKSKISKTPSFFKKSPVQKTLSSSIDTNLHLALSAYLSQVLAEQFILSNNEKENTVSFLALMTESENNKNWKIFKNSFLILASKDDKNIIENLSSNLFLRIQRLQYKFVVITKLYEILCYNHRSKYFDEKYKKIKIVFSETIFILLCSEPSRICFEKTVKKIISSLITIDKQIKSFLSDFIKFSGIYESHYSNPKFWDWFSSFLPPSQSSEVNSDDYFIIRAILWQKKINKELPLFNQYQSIQWKCYFEEIDNLLAVLSFVDPDDKVPGLITDVLTLKIPYLSFNNKKAMSNNEFSSWIKATHFFVLKLYRELLLQIMRAPQINKELKVPIAEKPVDSENGFIEFEPIIKNDPPK